MTIEFIFEGESLTLATRDEMRMAILKGKHTKTENGLSTYVYKGQKFIIADRDLEAEAKARSAS